jgi:DNA-binding NarL/FixJ family response regulator
MSNPLTNQRRVLIASNHPIFAQGLKKLFRTQHQPEVEVVGVVSNLAQAMQALAKLKPDLIIVDYDDHQLDREQFLARFVESETTLRVVLLSLQSAGDAVIYDRRTLAASQIDTWLKEWITTDQINQSNGTPSPDSMTGDQI